MLINEYIILGEIKSFIVNKSSIINDLKKEDTCDLFTKRDQKLIFKQMLHRLSGNATQLLVLMKYNIVSANVELFIFPKY